LTDIHPDNSVVVTMKWVSGPCASIQTGGYELHTRSDGRLSVTTGWHSSGALSKS
jgi:hypothetical protein